MLQDASSYLCYWGGICWPVVWYSDSCDFIYSIWVKRFGVFSENLFPAKPRRYFNHVCSLLSEDHRSGDPAGLHCFRCSTKGTRYLATVEPCITSVNWYLCRLIVGRQVWNVYRQHLFTLDKVYPMRCLLTIISLPLHAKIGRWNHGGVTHFA